MSDHLQHLAARVAELSQYRKASFHEKERNTRQKRGLHLLQSRCGNIATLTFVNPAWGQLGEDWIAGSRSEKRQLLDLIGRLPVERLLVYPPDTRHVVAVDADGWPDDGPFAPAYRPMAAGIPDARSIRPGLVAYGKIRPRGGKTASYRPSRQVGPTRLRRGAGTGGKVIDRGHDSEFLLVNMLANVFARRPPDAAVGELYLATERIPCASCTQVIKRFLDDYRGVALNLVYFYETPRRTHAQVLDELQARGRDASGRARKRTTSRLKLFYAELAGSTIHVTPMRRASPILRFDRDKLAARPKWCPPGVTSLLDRSEQASLHFLSHIGASR